MIFGVILFFLKVIVYFDGFVANHPEVDIWVGWFMDPDPVLGLSLWRLAVLRIRYIQGVSKKNFTLGIYLISLAINMLEGWDITYLKSGIHSSICNTKRFLYNIRKPRYKQNNMGDKMSKI